MAKKYIMYDKVFVYFEIRRVDRNNIFSDYLYIVVSNEESKVDFYVHINFKCRFIKNLTVEMCLGYYMYSIVYLVGRVKISRICGF